MGERTIEHMFESSDIDDAGLVDRLQAAERSIAVAQAEQLTVIAELHARAPAWITTTDPAGGGVDPIELTVAEVGLALRMSKISAYRRTQLALQVQSRLPGTLAALGRGAISMAKLRVIAEATEELSLEHAAAVEASVLPRAEGQTPAGLGASVARAVIGCDPAAAERRRAKATRERTVQFFPAADGMATLWLRGPVEQTMAAHRRICELAESARTPEDDRSAGARQADTLLDLIMDTPGVTLLDRVTQFGAGSAAPADDANAHGNGNRARDGNSARGHAPGGGASLPVGRCDCGATGSVSARVTVAWTTLAGIDELPAQLAGYGSITAAHARQLAADATWQRLLTDPASGTVLDVGTTRYRPPAALAALVRARDGTCRWFGCRRPAERCDLDHTEPHPREPTADRNLEALCRAHHRLKTHTAWSVAQHDGGMLTWTSPTGQRVITEPWTAGPDQPEPAGPPSYDDARPADPPEPDWLDALPTEAEIATQLARYDAAHEYVCLDEDDDDRPRSDMT